MCCRLGDSRCFRARKLCTSERVVEGSARGVCADGADLVGGGRLSRWCGSTRRGSRDIEHLGSAHSDAEVEVLKAVAAQRIAAGQDELPFGVVSQAGAGCRWRSPASRMGRLLDADRRVCLSPARARMRHAGAGCGVRAAGDRPDHRTDQQAGRRAGAGRGGGAGAVVSDGEAATAQVRPTGSGGTGCPGACAAARAQLGPSALVLYDVTTLWFETDTGDGFREPGFSKERRLDPQITVGLAHRRNRGCR